jgi:hypothetical protein
MDKELTTEELTTEELTTEALTTEALVTKELVTLQTDYNYKNLVINMAEQYICNNCNNIHNDPKQHKDYMGFCELCKNYWDGNLESQKYCGQCAIDDQICIYCGVKKS